MDFKEDVKKLMALCDKFLKAVLLQGNESAWTDRMVEDIIKQADSIKKKYN